MSDPVTLDGRFTVEEVDVPKCTLPQDLDSLFKTKKFADITFNIGSDRLKAHKAILAGKSLYAVLLSFTRTVGRRTYNAQSKY